MPPLSTAVPLGVAEAATDPLNVSDTYPGDVTVQIVGTWVGTITFEASIDLTNWVAVLVTNVTTEAVPTGSTTTANGIFRIPATGMYVRARMSAYTSGTANIFQKPTMG
jgi:hypothetical protein